jgi:hypothetical protein
MQSGVGAVNDVDQTAVVNLNIICLNRDFAGAGIGVRCGRRYKVRDLLRVEWIADVDGANPCVEVSDEQYLSIIDRSETLIRRVRSEAPATAQKTPSGSGTW